MSPRALSIINAIGCLVLTGVVVVQWRKERSIRSELTQAKAGLALSLQQTDEEAKRRMALERDIGVLKESLEAARKAAESSSRDLVERSTANDALQAELTAARKQVAAWETALTARDARIEELSADLAAARRRLDEAIAKLKASGAR